MAVPPKSPPNHQPPPSAHPAPTAPPSAANPTHPADPAHPAAPPTSGKVDVSQLKLSYTTSTCVSRLEAAHQEVDAWSENLEKSLQEDVDNGALKVEEAAAVAAKYDVAAPKAKSQEPEAKETTPEMNEEAMAAAAKAKPA